MHTRCGSTTSKPLNMGASHPIPTSSINKSAASPDSRVSLVGAR